MEDLIAKYLDDQTVDDVADEIIHEVVNSDFLSDRLKLFVDEVIEEEKKNEVYLEHIAERFVMKTFNRYVQGFVSMLKDKMVEDVMWLQEIEKTHVNTATDDETDVETENLTEEIVGIEQVQTKPQEMESTYYFDTHGNVIDHDVFVVVAVKSGCKMIGECTNLITIWKYDQDSKLFVLIRHDGIQYFQSSFKDLSSLPYYELFRLSRLDLVSRQNEHACQMARILR